MRSNKLFYCLFFGVFLSLSLPALGQEYEYEDEEEGETTRKPTTDAYGISSQENFLDTFRVLAAAADNPNATVKPVTRKPKSTVSTTVRTRRTTTTEMSRPAEIAHEVNGILANVGILNIPGIVHSALSIGGEDTEDARTYVGTILNQIFCLPVLNNLSDCGRKRLAEAQKNNPSTTTSRPKRRKSTTAETSTAGTPTPARRRRRRSTTELAKEETITVTARPASNFIYQLLNRTDSLKSSMDAMNIK